MVRVVCPNFQRPRSRHSSGESLHTLDADIAQRAAEKLAAATGLDRRPFDSDAEISSDAYWDSDTGACSDVGTTDSGTEPGKNLDQVVKKRKARRRERNKISAQAYRQRRKEQALSQTKILTELQDHQKELLHQIKQLEIEKKQVEKFLRSCFTTADKRETSEDTTGTPEDTTDTHEDNADTRAGTSPSNASDTVYYFNVNDNNGNNNHTYNANFRHNANIPENIRVS